jgi:hypothetical protein
MTHIINLNWLSLYAFLDQGGENQGKGMGYGELTYRLITDRLWTYSVIPTVIVQHGPEKLEETGQKRPFHPFKAEMDPGKAGRGRQHTSRLCQLYREGFPQPIHHQDLPDRPSFGM